LNNIHQKELEDRKRDYADTILKLKDENKDLRKIGDDFIKSL